MGKISTSGHEAEGTADGGMAQRQEGGTADVQRGPVGGSR